MESGEAAERGLEIKALLDGSKSGQRCRRHSEVPEDGGSRADTSFEAGGTESWLVLPGSAGLKGKIEAGFL